MIYLIRHGQTQANLQGIYYGKSESPLTKQGEEDHKRAVETLKGKHIDTVIASPRQRCRVLGDELCALFETDLIIDSRLEEINFGIFEGLKYDEAQQKYPEEWDNWVNAGDDFRLKDGESVSMFEKRIDDFAEHLMGMALKKDIVIISHGGVISTLLCSLLKIDKDNKWRFKIGNGSVITIDHYEEYAYIVFD